MVASDRPPANGFVRQVRKLYNPVGFAKGYNFILFFIFGGAMLGFCLAHFQYLDFYGAYCSPVGGRAGPGECFYYLTLFHEKLGIQLHLYTVIPASFLAVFQFVPAIRHKLLLFHRINGYIIVILSYLSTVGALLVTRHAFGGKLSTQTAMGAMSIMFIMAISLAYYNIKRLQIEQHRAWMLRAWFYAGSIITLRLIQVIAAQIISAQGTYYDVWSCAKLESLLGGRLLKKYPVCAPYIDSTRLDQHAIVFASLSGGGPETAGAALDVTFGAAAWTAFALHAIGVELYLQFTPAEAERLRKVSYQRQLEAGMKRPGQAGITVDRYGDSAKWEPSSAVHQVQELVSSDNRSR